MTKNIAFLPLFGTALFLGVSGAYAQQPSPASEQENRAIAQENRPVESSRGRPLDVKTNPALPTIYVEGDSTVRNGTAGERGWGDELAAFFDTSKINVVNHALGGTSSRTFQTSGRWDKSVAMMQKGDFVLVQFGHNDGGAVNDNFRARASIKGNGDETQEIDNMLTHQHEVVHTFGWYMRKYVTDSKAKGAATILCSLIPRQTWKDGKIARANEGFGKWAKEAAAQAGGSFVDLNEIIAEEYEKLGPDAVKPLFKEGPHTNTDGAKINAQCVVAGLKGLPGTPLDQYLSEAGKKVAPFAEKK